MVERFERVKLLLRSLVDLRFEPVTWSGGLRRGSLAGEGPSERIVCASCNGDGVRRVRGISVVCDAEGCGGRGWLWVDAYTRRPIGSAETGTSRRVQAVRCDGCGGQGAFGNGRRCDRCGGSGWVEVPLERLRAVRVGGTFATFAWGPGDPPSVFQAVDEGFPGAGRALRERSVAGSYEELEAARSELRLVDRERSRLVDRVYVDQLLEEEELDDRGRRVLRDGLGFIVVRMPAEIRVPGWAARNERRRRERLKRRQAAA